MLKIAECMCVVKNSICNIPDLTNLTHLFLHTYVYLLPSRVLHYHFEGLYIYVLTYFHSMHIICRNIYAQYSIYKRRQKIVFGTFENCCCNVAAGLYREQQSGLDLVSW